jgi:hypothetical protein
VRWHTRCFFLRRGIMHWLWKLMAWLAVVILPGGMLLLPWLAADVLREGTTRKRRDGVSPALPPTSPLV